MSDSEESEESEYRSDSIESKSKPKPIQMTPNVRQYKPHFIPGTAFERKNKLIKSINYVRKRDKCLVNRKKTSICESIDGNDSDETIITDPTDECDWRNGPAKYWYDLVQLPEDCRHYDYGLKLRADSDANNSTPTKSCIDTEDSFNLVSQVNWESNVIWDPDLVRQKVMKSVDKPSIAGWIPVEGKRSAPEFVKQIVHKNDNILDNCAENDCNISDKNTINDKLKTDEKNVKKTAINGFSRNLRKRKLNNNKICDKSIEILEKRKPIEKIVEEITEWVSTLPEENRELAMSRWEDNIIWDIEAMDCIPEPKVIPFSCDDDNAIIELSHCLDENSNDSSQVGDEPKHLTNNFNISNDEFYASVVKADNNATHSLIIRHSIPAINLNELCFPTCVQDFNRPVLKRSRTLVSKVGHKVNVCTKQMKLKEKLIESENQNSKDLSQYSIKSIRDLTACDGDIVLMEYAEEDPPLMMRPGMGSKITNYFKRSKDAKDKTCSLIEYRYGETKTVLISSPFIGEITAGQSQLALETNMFRSPIFEHTLPETDFLVIRTNDSYYVREWNGLFVVGQQLPLMEVPRPKAKTNYDFIKQFAKMFIYRYFNGRKSVKNLDIELQKAFPNISKHFCTSILRSFTKKQSDCFVLKSQFPFDIQNYNLLTPEHCCAYYSTTSAAHKLRERGYGDRLYLDDDIDDDNKDNKLDELAFVPWNTTVSYIATLNGRKWLKVSECNEDGILVFTNQSYRDFKEQMPTIKKCNPISDLSLKRMTLKRAHEWLINYGMSREKVRKLRNVSECNSRIKDLSEKLRQNGVRANVSKKLTTEQHYRFESQKVFDLHSSYCSSKEVFSTDDEDDEEEEEECDSDLEDMGKDLEAMILQNKTLEEIEYEREEEERKAWVRSLKGIKDPNKTNGESKPSLKGKVLKIKRQFEMNGKVEYRTEIVRRREVIEAYVRIRQNKSEDFIKQLSFVRNHTESGKLNTKSKSKLKPNNCVNKAPKPVNGISKTITENIDNNCNDFNKIDVNDDNWEISEEKEQLVSLDGSVVRFSRKVVIEANEIEAEEQRRLKEEMEAERKEREFAIDYFGPRTSQRCRIDPMVKLKDTFDKLIVEVRKRQELDKCIDFFIDPVKDKEFPDYKDIVKNPMDLKTIRCRVNQGWYSTRDNFLRDIHLIYENSLEYNGDEDDESGEVTKTALKLYEYCTEKLTERAEELAKYENMLSSKPALSSQ